MSGFVFGSSFGIKFLMSFLVLQKCTSFIFCTFRECNVLDWRPEGLRDRASLASLRCGLWARHIYPSLVLAQPRKGDPYIAERLLMGHKESNQTKTKKKLRISLSCTMHTFKKNWFIDPDNQKFFNIKLWLFSYPSVGTCVLGAQKNRLIETVLLSTHNKCFAWEIWKIIFNYLLLSGGL